MLTETLHLPMCAPLTASVVLQVVAGEQAETLGDPFTGKRDVLPVHSVSTTR